MPEIVHNAYETAERLRLSLPTVYKLLRDGELQATRVFRQWRITSSAIDNFLRGGSGGQSREVEREAV